MGQDGSGKGHLGPVLQDRGASEVIFSRQCSDNGKQLKTDIKSPFIKLMLIVGRYIIAQI